MSLPVALKDYTRLIRFPRDAAGNVVDFRDGMWWDHLNDAAHFFVPRFAEISRLLDIHSVKSLSEARDRAKADPVVVHWSQALESPHWARPLSDKQIRIAHDRSGPLLLQKALLAVATLYHHAEILNARRPNEPVNFDLTELIVPAVWTVTGFDNDYFQTLKDTHQPVLEALEREIVLQTGMPAATPWNGRNRSVAQSVHDTLNDLSKGKHAHHEFVAVVVRIAGQVGGNLQIQRGMRAQGGRGNVKSACAGLVILPA